MEATKRKYEKKSTEGKITVKHFLNTKLKPVPNVQSLQDGKDRYAIYVRIVVLGKTFDIKSKIKFPIALDEFEFILSSQKEYFDREINRILHIIKFQRPFESLSFDLKGVSLSYNNATIPLNEAIENTLKRKIQSVLKSIANFDEKERNSLLEEKKKTLEYHNDIEKYSEQLYKIANEVYLEYPIQVYKGFYELLDWQNSSAKNIIDFLRDSIFKQNIRGFEEFYSLYNEYSNLWNFEMIYSELLHRCKILEPTPIDWFESDFIQKIITDIEPQSGGEIIKNINKLLGENPFNKF